MKKAIISGATGAIGSALINELILHEIEVLVFCREGSKRNDVIPDHPLVEKKYASLADFEKLENNTGKEYDVFYHLAWDGTSGSARNDIYLQNSNVKYALDAVELAKRYGCKKFIGVGSQAEYGIYEGVLGPNTPVNPNNGYGFGKLAAGLMTRELAHQKGLQHVWVRVVSVYGPNDGDQTMVMNTISKLRFGEIPTLTKGEQMWDYLYSADAARAFYLLGDKGIDGKIYVLGSGTVRPLKDYIKIIRDIVAPKSELGFGKLSYSNNQVMYLCADISELKTDTGWTPTISFEEGIKKLSLNII